MFFDVFVDAGADGLGGLLSGGRLMVVGMGKGIGRGLLVFDVAERRVRVWDSIIVDLDAESVS